jgi:hypothetical protein
VNDDSKIESGHTPTGELMELRQELTIRVCGTKNELVQHVIHNLMWEISDRRKDQSELCAPGAGQPRRSKTRHARAEKRAKRTDPQTQLPPFR